MNEPQTNQLVEACRRGDPAAFEELYRAFADGVYHVAFRVLRNHDDATDATQETFLLAFRRIATFRGDGSLKGWMMRISVRVALRMAQRRRPALALDEETGLEPAAEDVPPTDEDFRNAVERAVGKLPEKARLVFILHTTEAMTHAEIGSALGITEGTSKSQLNYARNLLKQKLSRWCHELP